MSDDFDPVTLEIFWSRLISIADESAAALLRTSFSTIVRESNDFGTVLMDANGDSLSENTGGIPSFSGILPRTLKHFLERFPKETWKPGDCVITNDPWLATGHLPDITMAMPIFHDGALVGFSGSVAHSPDIGGSLWSADCRELFEEGLRIPPTKFLIEGEPNELLQEIILSNVRLPDQVLGDLNAQVTANQVCGRRLNEFLGDAGLPDLSRLSGTLQQRAETAMRRAIEEVPDGVYSATLDADGFDEAGTQLECAITIKGSDLTIDYAGTSPQIDRGLNTVMNYTYAYSAYPIKCALDPNTPRNEGSYRPITVEAPEGCILNPRYPAPCNASSIAHWPTRSRTASLPTAAARRRCARCSAGWTRTATGSPRYCSPAAAWAPARTRTDCRPRPSRPIRARAASRRSKAFRRWSSGRRNCGSIPAARVNIAAGSARSAKSRFAPRNRCNSPCFRIAGGIRRQA